MLRSVVRLLKCRTLGHRYRMIRVPVAVDAVERFGSMPRYSEFRLMFENTIRVTRMVVEPPKELRCVRCFVRMVPRAAAVNGGAS